MRRFKVGQKVVFAHPELIIKHHFNRILKGEVVIIGSYCDVYPDNYDIIGHEYSDTSRLQSYPDCAFEPIIEKSEKVTYKLSMPVPKELLQLPSFVELETVKEPNNA